MPIGTNIDYTKREIISWEPDGREATKSVILNTGEAMMATHGVQSVKSVYILTPGSMREDVLPDTGYESMASVIFNVYMSPFYAYKDSSDNVIYTRILPQEAGSVDIVKLPLEEDVGTFVKEDDTSYIEYNGNSYYRDDSKDYEF